MFELNVNLKLRVELNRRVPDPPVINEAGMLYFDFVLGCLRIYIVAPKNF